MNSLMTPYILSAIKTVSTVYYATFQGIEMLFIDSLYRDQQNFVLLSGGCQGEKKNPPAVQEDLR